eukprot:TRINITY_DN50541_c0_g1_i1.p1 TRINITY_DN50541_c0_g1~~TRINITY_DN50541_c0_g1_i1.p1  ORF type:complete len:300 (+),score=29.86 TRINITY_DN50541_c0_g1_i1:84-902(+)
MSDYGVPSYGVPCEPDEDVDFDLFFDDGDWSYSPPRRRRRKDSADGPPGGCWNCGGPHRKDECPNIVCYKCQGKGHLARDCTSARKLPDGAGLAEFQALLSRYLGKRESNPRAIDDYPKRLRMYHGTSAENAAKIEREGFKVSAGGQLGPGVYLVGDSNVAKVKRFAHDYDLRLSLSARTPKTKPALVEVVVLINRPKFITGNSDDEWIKEGYDAVRSDSTAMSSSSEWCLKSPSMIECIVRVHDLSEEGQCPWGSKQQCPYSRCPCTPPSP